MNELVYPTLDLFVYQLRNGLGDNEEQVRKNHERFWKNLPDKLKVDLDRELEAQSTEYTKLLDLLKPALKDNLHIKENHFFFRHSACRLLGDFEIEGYYYPARLEDTYGLLFDCSVNDRVKPQPVSCFQDLREQAAAKKGNLGKTWMISGFLRESAKPDSEALANLAKQAYKEGLMPGEWQEQKPGKFLGATVFEVWKSPQKWQKVEEENRHVLIILYPNSLTMQKAAGFYGDWLRLFCYRNKVLWEYGYSQQLTRRMQDEFKSVRDKIQKVKNLSSKNGTAKLNYKQLQELQEILKNSIATLSDYVSNLSYLEILSIAIDTNLGNYQKDLSKIVKKAKEKREKDSELGDTDLELLKSFSKTVREKYKVQVAKDHASLTTGLRVLEDLINTVRGIVEIQQQQSDRTLNSTIAIASVGLATSQIASAVILAQIPENREPLAYQTAVFFWSLGIGAITIVLALIILRIFRR